MRSLVAILALGLWACAGLPEVDPETHARLTVEGFREASPFAAERLDTAVAWAVFPDVEDARDACDHGGWLFRPDGPARPAALRCGARPSAPAGAAYHVLVVLEDPADLERLGSDRLELAGSRYVTIPGEPLPDEPAARRLVLTTARGSLLFGSWSPLQSLEVVPSPGTGASR